MIPANQMPSWLKLNTEALKWPFSALNSQPQSISTDHILLEFGAHSLNDVMHQSLINLALESQLKEKIDDLFLGKKVNVSEKRAALHVALRSLDETEFFYDGMNIMPKISDALDQMRLISNQIRSGTWLGYSAKPITDLVNIGIGGSHLGAAFSLHALSEHQHPALRYHFISDLDPHAFSQATKNLDPSTTVFIVSSKSFTSIETLENLKKAKEWLNQSQYLDQHFIAVTACAEKAYALGLNRVIPIWDWVGGRFSACSAINLITCIAIGYDLFKDLLFGAQSMDHHFRHTPFIKNLPVNLALLGIWANNFLNIRQLLVMSFGHRLDHLVPYLQQLDMESNGKSVDSLGHRLNYPTGPILWGGAGNQIQHSYYQLLAQGTHRIAAEFISVDSRDQHASQALCLAQKEVLSDHEALFHQDSFSPRPSLIHHLRLKDLSPRTMGSLISLYEHKIYVQSVIWRTNAFDQPGVDSSKNILKKDFAYG